MVEIKPLEIKTRRIPWKYIFLFLGIAVIVAILGVVGFLLMQSRNVDHYFQAGFKEYDSAYVRLDRGLEELAKVKIGKDPADLGVAAKKISKKVPAAKTDLDRAIKDFKRMRSTAITGWEREAARLAYKSAYQAKLGTEELGQKLDVLSDMAGMLVKVEQASDRFTKAFAKTNEAIRQSNDNNFTEAKKTGALAEGLFRETQAFLTDAGKLGSDKDLKSIIPMVSKGRQWATRAIEMAEAGEAKKVNIYNKLARENNDLSEEVSAIARKPILADPREWMRNKLDKLNDRVEVHFNRADEWREKALKVWRQNT